jgi:hypothetical protein
MLAAHRHPEFGYLCPSPALRWACQAVLVLCAIGLIAGANCIGASVGDRDADGTIASASVRPREPATGMTLVAVAPTVAAAGSAEKIKITPPAGRAAEQAAADRGSIAPGPLVASRAAAVAKTEATAARCEPSAVAHVDRRCEGGTMRSVRLVPQEPPAGADGVSRGSSTPASTRKTATPTPPNQQTKSPAVLSSAPAAAQTAPAAREDSDQTVAVAKKPRKVAVAHSRQRGPSSSGSQSRPNGPNFNQNPFAALFGGFR